MTRTFVLVWILLALSACDASFGRRWDIGGPIAGATPEAFESRILEAVSTYGAKEGLACVSGGHLPVECYLQPVRVWAVAGAHGATVCYAAMGVPFERGEYEARMKALGAELDAQVGGGRVTVTAGGCPPPPSFSRQSD